MWDKGPVPPKGLHCIKKFAVIALAFTVAVQGIVPATIAHGAENTGSSAGMTSANPEQGYRPDAGNGVFRDVPLPGQLAELPSSNVSNRAQVSTFAAEGKGQQNGSQKSTAQKKDVTYVRVTSDIGINVRKGPGTNHPVIGKLPFNERVKYLGKATASDKSIWYKIQCDFGVGYGHSDYLEMEKEYHPSGNFEEALEKEGFPESYKKHLRKIHANYPNWHFVGDHTGLNWDTVIEKETNPVSINLVSHIRSDTWKSVEPGAYNTATNEYISYDSGGWVPADIKVVKYFMDPRNFLNTSGIFQFMSNKYDSATATAKNVGGVTAGTFMSGKFPEKVNGKSTTYNQVICDIGKKTGVNPMVIASIIIQEQGTNGGGRSISGTVSGFKGIYNYWNIGAYQTSEGSAVTNGLRYAKSQGWNSRYKAILGGAQWFADKYVNNNKYNSYLKKFNVMNKLENVGRGQYMTNVEAGYQEGVGLRNGYSSLLNAPLTFTIPIFHKMPADSCQLPVEKGSHINFLKTMTVKGVSSNGQVSSKALTLSPKFESREQNYKVTVPDSATKIQFSYKGTDPSVKVSIAGANSKHQVAVPVGSKTIKVKVTSTSTRYRYYNVTVTRKGGPNPDAGKPKPEPKPDPPKPKPEPPKPVKPPKVSGITLDSDFGVVKVSYKKSTNKNVSAYRISYREITGTGSNTKYGPWKWFDTTDTTVIMDNLKINGHYGVRVATVNKKDDIRSDYSKEYHIYSNRLGDKYGAPYAPKIEKLVRGNSGGSSKTNGTATVTSKVIKYKKTPKTVTYRIRYKLNGASSWKYVSSSSNVRKITGLTRGKTYSFQVSYRYTSALDGKTVIELPYTGTKNLKI